LVFPQNARGFGAIQHLRGVVYDLAKNRNGIQKPEKSGKGNADLKFHAQK
jgi:hypothetical protein